MNKIDKTIENRLAVCGYLAISCTLIFGCQREPVRSLKGRLTPRDLVAYIREALSQGQKTVIVPRTIAVFREDSGVKVSHEI